MNDNPHHKETSRAITAATVLTEHYNVPETEGNRVAMLGSMFYRCYHHLHYHHLQFVGGD